MIVSLSDHVPEAEIGRENERDRDRDRDREREKSLFPLADRNTNLRGVFEREG